VEQVLDVRADPNAKMRLLNGLVNVAACPQCGMQGALNIPFLYHDPDKELALVFMPMDAIRDNLERQRIIGNMTSAVMNGLPPEERKGYLFQPQEFLTLENLANRILEADGVTPEMIAEQKAKAELLQRMLEASSDDVLEAMIEANDDEIDVELLQMLTMNLEVAQSAGHDANVQRIVALRNKLLELSSVGRRIKARGEVLEALQTEPTHENLVELLVQAPDEETRRMLVTVGRPMLDYRFFRALTARIDSADDESERKRLTVLRAEVLEIRDILDARSRALYAERSALLRDLLLSDDPEALALRRSQELDQAFFSVLASQLEEAQSSGDQRAVEALQGIWSLLVRLAEESLPPEIQLLNRLMTAEDDATVEQLLQENRDLVTERLVQFMEQAEVSMREEDSLETAERLARVREKAQAMVGGSGILTT
jgi:hypothetical protein